MSEIPSPRDIRRAHDDLQVRLVAALAEEETTTGRALLREFGAAMEELRVAREDLQAQAEQLAASAAAIDRERERYAELFDFAPDAYVETDEMGRITEGNRAASHLFGAPVRQMTGKLLVSYVHADQRRAFHRLLTDVMDGTMAGERTLRMHSRSGRQVTAGVSAAHHPSVGAGAAKVRWLIRDITDRVKLQDQIDDLSDEVELLTRLGDVQQVIQTENPLAETLQRIVDLAQRTLPGCEIGLSLVGRSDMERSITTGRRAEGLEERQRREGEGPSVEALRGTAVVRGRPEEWPALAGVSDVSEIIGVPIATTKEIDGALSVYVLRGRLDDRSLHLLLLLAEQCSVAVENARLFGSSIALIGGLERAMESRGVIERAKGVLMAHQGCDAEEAFDILRRASQRENVKLHQIAVRLMDSATLPMSHPLA